MTLLRRRLDHVVRRLTRLGSAVAGTPPPPRVVFLHIPKTGGSTVNGYFKRHLGSSHSGGAVGLNSAAGIDAAALERARRARFVFGHFGWRTLQEVADGAFAFTVLRDPADRILSLYRFARRRELPAGSGFEPLMAASRGTSFEAFCLSSNPAVRRFIDNAQARTLAAGYLEEERGFDDGEATLALARAHLEALDFVALTETLDQDFPSLAEGARLPPPRAAPRRNVGEDPAAPPASLEEARAILGARIALDEALYAFAKTLRSPR